MSCNNKWSMLAALLVGASLLTGCITEVEPEQDDVELNDTYAMADEDIEIAEADETDEVMQGEEADDGLTLAAHNITDVDKPEVSVIMLNGDDPDDPMTVLSEIKGEEIEGGGEDEGRDELSGPDPQPWHHMAGPDPQPWELSGHEQDQEQTQGPDPQPWEPR